METAEPKKERKGQTRCFAMDSESVASGRSETTRNGHEREAASALSRRMAFEDGRKTARPCAGCTLDDPLGIPPHEQLREKVFSEHPVWRDLLSAFRRETQVVNTRLLRFGVRLGILCCMDTSPLNFRREMQVTNAVSASCFEALNELRYGRPLQTTKFGIDRDFKTLSFEERQLAALIHLKANQAELAEDIETIREDLDLEVRRIMDKDDPANEPHRFLVQMAIRADLDISFLFDNLPSETQRIGEPMLAKIERGFESAREVAFQIPGLTNEFDQANQVYSFVCSHGDVGQNRIDVEKHDFGFGNPTLPYQPPEYDETKESDLSDDDDDDEKQIYVARGHDEKDGEEDESEGVEEEKEDEDEYFIGLRDHSDVHPRSPDDDLTPEQRRYRQKMLEKKSVWARIQASLGRKRRNRKRWAQKDKQGRLWRRNDSADPPRYERLSLRFSFTRGFNGELFMLPRIRRKSAAPPDFEPEFEDDE